MVALSFVMLNQSAFMLKTSLHWVWVKLSTPNLTLRTGYGNKLNSPSNITTVVTRFLPHYFENQVRSTSNTIFQWNRDQTTKCRSWASHSNNHVLGLIIYDTLLHFIGAKADLMIYSFGHFCHGSCSMVIQLYHTIHEWNDSHQNGDKYKIWSLWFDVGTCLGMLCLCFGAKTPRQSETTKMEWLCLHGTVSRILLWALVTGSYG